VPVTVAHVRLRWLRCTHIYGYTPLRLRLHLLPGSALHTYLFIPPRWDGSFVRFTHAHTVYGSFWTGYSLHTVAFYGWLYSWFVWFHIPTSHTLRLYVGRLQLRSVGGYGWLLFTPVTLLFGWLRCWFFVWVTFTVAVGRFIRWLVGYHSRFRLLVVRCPVAFLIRLCLTHVYVYVRLRCYVHFGCLVTRLVTDVTGLRLLDWFSPRLLPHVYVYTLVTGYVDDVTGSTFTHGYVWLHLPLRLRLHFTSVATRWFHTFTLHGLLVDLRCPVDVYVCVTHCAP